VRSRLLVATLPVVAALALTSSATPAAAATSCNGTVDVAVGAPQAEVGGQAGAGEVTVVFEGTAIIGDDSDRTLSEQALYAAIGKTPPATAGDGFGTALAVGRDPADPGCSVLAIGAPGASGGAGAVWVVTIDKDGVFPDTVRRLTQNSPGIGDTAEAGDAFGSAVYFGGGATVRWLAVGVPFEDVGTVKDAGMVHVLPYPGLGSGTKTYRSGAGGVPGQAEAGDHLGASLGPGRDVWSLWVGVPEEDVGTIKDAGALMSLPGSSSSATVHLPGTIGSMAQVTQESARVPGASETYDHFGAVLGGLTGSTPTSRQPVVGVPREDVGTLKDAGVMLVTYEDRTWVSFRQGAGGVGSVAEAGDLFGAALASWDSVLLVGVPGEDVGTIKDAGSIHRFTSAGSVPKLSGAREQTLNQDSSGVADTAEAGDQFGTSVALAARGAVVGVPGEEVGPEVDAGAVELLPYVSGAPELGVSGTGSLLLQATDLSLEGSITAGARFGTALASY
jgi:hypothetical protein